MWPFTPRAKPDSDQDLRLARMEKKVRDMELDWADQYDKFHRLYLRLQKRAKTEAKRAEDGSGDTNGDHPGGNQPMNPLAARLLNPYGRKMP